MAKGLAKGIVAVLFDFDDTLTSGSGLRAAHSAVARALLQLLKHKEVGMKEVLSRVMALEDRMTKKARYERDEWWPVLLRELGIDIAPQEALVKGLTSLYWCAYADNSSLRRETLPVLSHLRDQGYRLGLVTDTDGEPGMKLKRIERVGILKFLDAIVIAGEDTEETKPSPSPFLFAAQRLNTLPENCAFVGDKPFTDIKGAKAAGMRTVLLKIKDWGRDEVPDYVVRSLWGLRRLF